MDIATLKGISAGWSEDTVAKINPEYMQRQ